MHLNLGYLVQMFRMLVLTTCQLTTLCNTSGCGREERGKMEWIIILLSLIELIAQLQFASRRSELTVMEQSRFKVGVLTLSVSTLE